MPRNEVEPLVRLHVLLFESDAEELKEIYNRERSVGVAKAIRQIVRSALKRRREWLAAQKKDVEIPEDQYPDFPADTEEEDE